MSDDYLGARIKRLREEKRLTQRELARMAGISCAFICQIETGPKRGITIQKLYGLCSVLDVSIDCLVKGLYTIEEPRRKRTICVTDADFARIEMLLKDQDEDEAQERP